MIRDPRGGISQKSFVKDGQGAGGNIGAANPSHFLRNNKTVRRTVAKILENFARFKSTLIVVKGKMLDWRISFKRVFARGKNLNAKLFAVNKGRGRVTCLISAQRGQNLLKGGVVGDVLWIFETRRRKMKQTPSREDTIEKRHGSFACLWQEPSTGTRFPGTLADIMKILEYWNSKSVIGSKINLILDFLETPSHKKQFAHIGKLISIQQCQTESNVANNNRWN